MCLNFPALTNMFLIALFLPISPIDSINEHLDLLSRETIIVKKIWHVLQKVVKCYFVPLPQLSYIY